MADDILKQPGEQSAPSETDLINTINQLIDQRLSSLGMARVQKVTIDPSYTTGNPKIQRPGDSAPGGSNKTQKVFKPYGTSLPVASQSAAAITMGNGVV